MSKHEFKTESKQLLNLMINSIYTHKEIFLRELISNSSDAIDKYNYLSLTDDRLKTEENYEIEIIPNKDAKTITIKDNGIGMTKEELMENLGTIAKSGSKAFIEKLKESKDNVDIIGQFGVGFYSAFMVADKVVVKTKSPYEDTGYVWESTGESDFTIEDLSKNEHGTEITLHLRENDDDESYDTYLEEYKIKELVKKYSDYVRYPITMEVTKEVPKNDDASEDTDKEPEYETVIEQETLNSMVPIWKKKKSEVSDEDFNEFYKYQFHDYENPLTVINKKVEGMLNYNALLFIPKRVPQDFYTDQFEKGLQLYSKGVFIMDKCKELIPDHFRFVKGLVDSPDLTLNISREMLQHSRQLKKIASNLEKKIKSELEKMLRNDRESYIELFEQFGVNIKYGLYDQFGAKKDLLKDLVMYISSETKEYTTLKEYVERMKDNQEFIYYASGSSKEQIDRLPQMELLKEKGYEVLYFKDDVDEFAINFLTEYDEKKFKNISQGDLNLESEEEKKEIEEKEKEYKDMMSYIKDSLKDKVSEVKISSRLKESAVCLVSKDGVSFEMERILKSMPNNNGMMKAERVLELNPNHNLFKALENLYNNNKEEVKDYADLLYDQALLVEGFELEDPVKFANKMSNLMVKSIK
ncbi:molecular chaperone HtpG [Haloplasma contractile]|uniref:Chaperone protein HtpG n=1 Tax=Haloplasma contractile SSD-17B TaxID=1033810 RepID=U2FLC2_9MOLU|nr:molecular chaperone HtpG [Haloplasma contractile]ERJ11994.1 Chaperone protein HtpG [Haloplasma contractile SSD-17B]